MKYSQLNKETKDHINSFRSAIRTAIGIHGLGGMSEHNMCAILAMEIVDLAFAPGSDVDFENVIGSAIKDHAVRTANEMNKKKKVVKKKAAKKKK